MRRLLLWTALAAGLAAPVRAEDGIPRDTLAALKAATAFVKVETPRGDASGSGFLMKVDGDAGYVITNHHVVTPPANLHLGTPTISLVFNSGRKEEKTYPAEVLATDPDRDLAVLKVVAKDLPAPLDLSQKVDVVETMTVYMLGFPFGEELSLTKGNPAVTVGKGTVSSIRQNDRGDVGRIQIDGDLNPGNSGGPVVDEKGRLIGIAVAKIRGTGIGMAIPPGELTRMLNGRISALGVHILKVADGAADVKIVMDFIDPLNKIQSAAVRYARADPTAAPLQADKTGAWPALPGSEKVDLKLDKQQGVAALTLQASDKDKGPVVFQFQPVYVNGDGDTVLAQPTSRAIDFTKAAAVAPAPPGGKVPDPVEGKGSLLGVVRTVGDLTVMDLKLEGAKAPRCLCWSADGKAFFHLHPDGVLTRVSLGELSEQKRLDVGRGCGWLSVSAEGLVLTVLDVQEAWLIDPDTFRVKAKIAVPSPKWIVSSPRLSVAYSVTPDGIQVIDLKAGKVVKEYAPNDLDGHASGSLPAVTPDGKYLFLVGGIEQLMRFAIDGPELKFEEASQRIAQGRLEGVDVGLDSSHVCIPSGGGNYGGEGLPDVGSYCTYIFPVTNLAKPDAVLRQGAYPEAVGFDPKAGLIYGQNFEKSLIVFSDAGTKQKEYDLGVGGVKQLFVHPDGRKLLVMGDKICYVELPKP